MSAGSPGLQLEIDISLNSSQRPQLQYIQDWPEVSRSLAGPQEQQDWTKVFTGLAGPQEQQDWTKVFTGLAGQQEQPTA